jgi:hypothetical protein
MEAGVVIDRAGLPLYWHMPEGRTWGSLPDSALLWDVLWTRRHEVAGFAHSHPGQGAPAASHEDVTTFAAIEAALGRRLDWWITSEDELWVVRLAEHAGRESGYRASRVDSPPGWLAPLRAASRPKGAWFLNAKENGYGRSSDWT